MAGKMTRTSVVASQLRSPLFVAAMTDVSPPPLLLNLFFGSAFFLETTDEFKASGRWDRLPQPPPLPAAHHFFDGRSALSPALYLLERVNSRLKVLVPCGGFVLAGGSFVWLIGESD
ncbi:hypothetical protein Rs2_24791 [Raphanus sativus]|nr:hypothetical protein Rs2_24791 [Raphanus sativus]